MYQVIKRDGHVAEFSLNRISSAIMKAFDATHIPYAPDVIDLLSLQVTADYADKIRDGRIDVETIQDSVEAVLQRAGYAEVAKAYILYRKNREKLRNMSSTILDYKKLVDDYLRVSVYAHRLLRRLEPEAAHSGRVGGCDGQDHQRPGQAPGYPMQPDGEFPGHYAERVGGCAGIFQL